jgi:hypothetical protein
MEQAYLSAASALAGTVIGGVTSFATTWLTTSAQARAARLAAERDKREDAYGRFMEVLAALYAFALDNQGVDYPRMAQAYALRGRIVLMCSQPVAVSADTALKFIVDLMLAPRRSDAEMRRCGDAADDGRSAHGRHRRLRRSVPPRACEPALTGAAGQGSRARTSSSSSPL